MLKFTQKQKEIFSFTGHMLVLPIVLLYYECIFLLTTTGKVFNAGTLNMFLFSVFYGIIAYLILSIFKSHRAIYIGIISVMGVGALFYLIHAFIYRQFKVFYDLNTVIYGTNDVMNGFMSEIFRLVFSWDGLLKIVLFAIPIIFYAVFGRRLFNLAYANAVRRIIAAAVAVLCYGVSLVLIYTNSTMLSVYKTQYNYQSAVQNFGLISGVGLDIRYMITGGAEGDFELGEHNKVPTMAQSDELLQQEPEEKEYGYNQLELDLSSTDYRVAELNTYINSLTASKKNEYTGIFEGKNLVLITAEAFTAEVISPELTPTLYRLANRGINFTDYYQPASAGTTGGEYQNIFGMLPTSGGASFLNTADNYNYMTIGSQLNRLGYYGKAYHNNDYTYYSRHKTHINLGYSDGFMGYGNGMEQYVKNAWPQSDLEMFEGTLPTYIDKQPFSVYYMTVSGHSDYTQAQNQLTAKNWESVANLPYSDRVKGYLAANLELEKAMAYLVGELEAKGIADDTVICISSDHFPYGLDAEGGFGNFPYLSELFGVNVENYFQRDHSDLIIWCGCLESEEPIVVNEPTFSLDILPTLSNLFGTEFDSRLFVGRDVFSDAEPLVFNTNYDWKTNYGTYYAATGQFVPFDETIQLPEGYVDNIKATVRNKMRYCKLALNNDYFRYLFEKEE